MAEPASAREGADQIAAAVAAERAAVVARFQIYLDEIAGRVLDGHMNADEGMKLRRRIKALRTDIELGLHVAPGAAAHG